MVDRTNLSSNHSTEIVIGISLVHTKIIKVSMKLTHLSSLTVEKGLQETSSKIIIKSIHASREVTIMETRPIKDRSEILRRTTIVTMKSFCLLVNNNRDHIGQIVLTGGSDLFRRHRLISHGRIILQTE